MTAHTVYVFRDASGHVLYVGCTGNLPQRLEFHGHSKAWFADVVTVKVEHFADRGSALEREAALIEELSPPYGGGVRLCQRRPCSAAATCYYAMGEQTRLVCEDHAPSIARPILPRYRSGLPDGDPRHGTWNGYMNHSCRCDACREANAAKQRARRAKAAS